MLHHTSPRCIILMLSRYWLQSWPTATCSNVLRHVIKQCWTVLHHAGSYSYQGNSSAFKCTCLLHFYWPPVLLWLLHAIMPSVGAYGCTLTHGACWRIPLHKQQLWVYVMHLGHHRGIILITSVELCYIRPCSTLLYHNLMSGFTVPDCVAHHTASFCIMYHSASFCIM